MNEYVTVGSTARAHSDNGNLKDDGKHTFVYDYKNRLIGAFDKATNNPVAAYLYYCDNRRAKKIVYSQTSPGVVERQERFFYDGQQVVEETDDAGNTLLTWVYSPVYVDEPVQMVRSASHPLGAGTFYLHQNACADVVAVTDSSGSVVERRLFDDYGRSFDGVSKAPVSGSAVGNVYGFQGRRLDSETGLYYFRARYYDPSTGRFVQRDPVWDPGNFGNQYSFVGNGPVTGVDPLGLGDSAAIERALERADVDKMPLWKKALWAVGKAYDEGMKLVYGPAHDKVSAGTAGGLGVVGKAGAVAKAASKLAKAGKAAKQTAKKAQGLKPGSPAHKAVRWSEYKARGGKLKKKTWERVYDANMKRALKAHKSVNRFHKKLGWGKREVTVEAAPGMLRRLDIADVKKLRGIEHKSGKYVCRSADILSELQRDALLVAKGWNIRWHFTGKASEPLLTALKHAGIKATGRRIP